MFLFHFNEIHINFIRIQLSRAMRKCVLCHMQTTKAHNSLISAFVVRCLDRIEPILAKSKISRLKLVFVGEQAGLSLT